MFLRLFPGLAPRLIPRLINRRLTSSIATLAALSSLALASATAAPDGVGAVGRPSAPGPFVRVLGTAQDGGFPHAACDCERCTLARQRPELRRLVASLAIALPRSGTVYLIDATPDLREQLDRLRDVRDPPTDRVDRSPVDGVFLTHAHIGHYLGLAFLGFEAVHTRSLPLYATGRMSTFIESEAPWDQLVRLGNVELAELRPGRAVELGEGVSVTPLWVPHRDEYTDTVGFRITGPSRTLLYIPDTDPWRSWPSPLEAALEGVDVALLDGSFYSPDELPGRRIEEIRHPLMSETMDRLEPLVEAGELEVWFTHINHSNPVLAEPSPERRRVEERGFRVLADLMEFPL